MYPIVKKEELAEKIFLMEVEAPRVAASCLPGQFVIVRTDEESERIPLTVCDYDREKGTITIVVQMVGASTEKMHRLNVGDAFHDFVGPLGKPSELCLEENLEETRKKNIVFVAGGLGTAPVYCQVKWLHEHGVNVTCIMGSRTKDLLFFVDKMNAVSDNHVTTDDGSFGFHGMGTDCLKSLWDAGNKFDLLPKEDFKGSLYLSTVEAASRVSTVRNPQTNEDMGEFEFSHKAYKTLKASSPCPKYLKSKKKL